MPDEKDQNLTQTTTTPVETETFTLDGKNATIELHDDGRIAVTLPEGLSAEAKESYVNSLKTGSKLIASLNKKLYDVNRARENDPTVAKVKELEQKIAELEGRQSRPGNQQKTLWEELGLDSESELKEFAAEHPDAYLTKLNELSMKKFSEQLESKTHQTIAQQSLTAQMKAKGLDPVEVKRYADYYGMPLTEKALDLYIRDHSGKRDSVLDAQMRAQELQITFMEPQKRAPNLSSLTKKDMARMSDSDLDAIIKS